MYNTIYCVSEAERTLYLAIVNHARDDTTPVIKLKHMWRQRDQFAENEQYFRMKNVIRTNTSYIFWQILHDFYFKNSKLTL